jgi:S-adenosylmethionine-diacylglycerol 3-amino-3-carboxypropyl transferase
MPSEIASRADFSRIRYGQCWEDADILLSALHVQPGDTCVSIASAGDNTLALLAADPARVIAVDLNPAQLACLALRIAAYRRLEHGELLELIGSRHSDRRADLYRRCRGDLTDEARAFWDAHPAEIAAGIGSAGKFESYFALFARRVLPLVHSRRDVDALLAGGSDERRERFYRDCWDTFRWRLLFRVFFSRFVMGRLGRDPALFRYVRGDGAGRILARTRHALTALNPAANPYLQWILRGEHATALPFALREENFEVIRRRLDRVELRRAALEDVTEQLGPVSVDRWNLSDIFEYMSPAAYEALLRRLIAASKPGARLAYWNMLADRRRPDTLADRLRPLWAEAERLHQQDKAFFYSRFVIEEVV